MKGSPSAGTPARYAQDDRGKEERKEERRKGRKEEERKD